MKTLTHFLLLTGLAGGLSGTANCLAADDPPVTNAPAPALDLGKTNGVDQAAPPAETPAPDQTVPPPSDGTPQPAPAASTNTAPQPGTDQVAAPVPEPKTVTLANGEVGLIMNFRNVQIEMVLDYMSTAAGFTIHPVNGTSLKGNVDVWNNQPMTKDAAVTLLSQVLEEKGLGIVRNGDLLAIDTVLHAQRTKTPVNLGNDPTNIIDNAEIVTQIIPVRSLNAIQLVKDLAPLLPTDTTLTANDAGNSLIMTDTQSNIRRVTEIIRALDSVSASVNTLKVFPLKYADAKALVTVITTIFPSQGTTGNGGGFGRFRPNGGGGGPFGGFNPFGGGNPGGGDAGSTGHTPTTRVSATSDDHSNSLIVSAPEDLMTLVGDMVTNLDQAVETSTEVRVIKLKNADPTEMCTLISNLYPDDSNSADASRNAPQFGGFRGLFSPGGPGGGRQGNNSASSDPSDRMKRLARVIAVPDPRTASVVITAAKEQLVDIVKMVEDLDSNPARKMHVFAYDLKSADPLDALNVLQTLFPTTTTSGSRPGAGGSSSTSANALANRQNQAAQSSGTTSSAFSGSSFGSGGGGGGRGAVP